MKKEIPFGIAKTKIKKGEVGRITLGKEQKAFEKWMKEDMNMVDICCMEDADVWHTAKEAWFASRKATAEEIFNWLIRDVDGWAVNIRDIILTGGKTYEEWDEFWRRFGVE